MFEGPTDIWNTRSARRRVSVPAFVYRKDGTVVRGQVCDLSHDGCNLLSEAEFDVDEAFTLDLPSRGKIAAEVRWRADVRYGVRLIVEGSGSDVRSEKIGD